jgi:hypothetical protein
MDYVFSIYADEHAVNALSPEQRRDIVAGHIAVYAALAEAGRLRWAAPLTDTPAARTLGPDGLVTDGPYAETKEQLGSVYVVACDSDADALEVARRFPAAPGHHVEIRPAQEV